MPPRRSKVPSVVRLPVVAISQNSRAEASAQTTESGLSVCWDSREKLQALRERAVELYSELQLQKPRTPSLSEYSFGKRQVQLRQLHQHRLSRLHVAAEIIAYACKLLAPDTHLLEVFLRYLRKSGHTSRSGECLDPSGNFALARR